MDKPLSSVPNNYLKHCEQIGNGTQRYALLVQLTKMLWQYVYQSLQYLHILYSFFLFWGGGGGGGGGDFLMMGDISFVNHYKQITMSPMPASYIIRIEIAHFRSLVEKHSVCDKGHVSMGPTGCELFCAWQKAILPWTNFHHSKTDDLSQAYLVFRVLNFTNKTASDNKIILLPCTPLALWLWNRRSTVLWTVCGRGVLRRWLTVWLSELYKLWRPQQRDDCKLYWYK